VAKGVVVIEAELVKDATENSVESTRRKYRSKIPVEKPGSNSGLYFGLNMA
jgi:hypothetical protein